jgi:hypothetical protein
VSTASKPVTGGAHFAPLLAGIAVGLAAFVWLGRLNPGFVVTDDGVRDQLMARDCTDLGRCHLIGPSTSLDGFRHGPVWLDLLIAVRLLGGDTASQLATVLAFVASGVATLYVVVWRWLGASRALPAAVLLVGALSFDESPSLLVPALACGAVAVAVCAGLGRRFRRWPWTARAWFLGAVMVLPFALGSLWLVFGQKHHFSVVERPFGTAACDPLDRDMGYPPCLLETRPGDPIQARARRF